MEAINFEQLLLKTAFCCMAADGNIDKREVSTIETLCEKSELFNDFNFHEAINHLVNEINTNSKIFIQEYFNFISHSKLSEQEELSMIDGEIIDFDDGFVKTLVPIKNITRITMPLIEGEKINARFCKKKKG